MPPFSPLSQSAFNLGPSPLKNVMQSSKSPVRSARTETNNTMQENIPPTSPSGEEQTLNFKPPTRHESPIKRLSPQKVPLSTSPSKSPLKRIDSDPFLAEHFDQQEQLQKSLHGGEDENALNTSFMTNQGFNPDETCFSTFSAVPNADMTAFARLAQSPIRSDYQTTARNTPSRQGRPVTPGTAVPQRLNVSPSKGGGRRHEDTMTTQLLEFTEQMNFTSTTSRSPTRNAAPLSPSRFRSQPDLLAGTSHRSRSPNKDGYNLLDFDLPPAPTPRSVPSITARELESLKAGFLSEISSLKAKLSGQAAEAQFLMEAKGDAERRVGELSEELREVKGLKDTLVEEKNDWQKRDKDMQNILRDIKDELLLQDKEHQELAEQLEEKEKKLEFAEARVSQAESKVAGLQAQVAPSSSSNGNKDGNQGDGKREGGAEDDPSTPGSSGPTAVEVAVERVARELHTLYKSKHEQKVGALKKSYEARWERKVKDLERKVDSLTHENEELRVGRDATMSGVVPGMLKRNEQEDPFVEEKKELVGKIEQGEKEVSRLSGESEASKKEAAEFRAKLEACERGIVRLEGDNQQLAGELEVARKENGELVAAVEEMLALQSEAQPLPAPATSSASSELAETEQEPQQQQQTRAQRRMSTNNGNASDVLSRSGSSASAPASRIGGLQRPGFGAGGGFGESRIGMAGSMKRSISGAGNAASGRSGIMSNIERMGKGRGAE